MLPRDRIRCDPALFRSIVSCRPSDADLVVTCCAMSLSPLQHVPPSQHSRRCSPSEGRQGRTDMGWLCIRMMGWFFAFARFASPSSRKGAKRKELLFVVGLVLLLIPRCVHTNRNRSYTSILNSSDPYIFTASKCRSDIDCAVERGVSTFLPQFFIAAFFTPLGGTSDSSASLTHTPYWLENMNSTHSDRSYTDIRFLPDDLGLSGQIYSWSICMICIYLYDLAHMTCCRVRAVHSELAHVSLIDVYYADPAQHITTNGRWGARWSTYT